METEDQMAARKLLDERQDKFVTEIALLNRRIAWMEKALEFKDKRFDEFTQSGAFGREAAFQAGKRARVEFVKLYGECP